MCPTDTQSDAQKDTVFTDLDSLQDIVKSFMLGGNFPHIISLDEITRVCKLPNMLLKVVPEKT